MEIDEHELEKYLKKHFNYEHFRTGQKEVITSVLEGNHTLAMLPTGTGKSLCYQFSGYILERTCFNCFTFIILNAGSS